MTKIISLQKTNSLYYNSNNQFKCFISFYKFVHILGLDFGFIQFEFMGIKIIPQMFALTQCIALIFTILYGILADPVLIIMWYSVSFIQYFCFTLILTCVKKESKFCNLIKDLRAIDIGLKAYQASYNLEIKLFFLLACCLIYRVLVTVLLCFVHPNCQTRLQITILCTIMLATIDIVRVSNAYMFYAINCRLKVIASLLKKTQVNFLEIQYLYKSIIDIAEQHKNAYASVLLVALLFNVPQGMTIMFLLVQEIRRTSSFPLDLNFAVDYINVAGMLILSVLPAISAGMLTVQADKIRVILHDLLLLEQDEAKYLQIEHFIHYVEARGCRFRVYKLIPLNADLIGMVLKFFVTYLIVIIQFTNK